MGAPAEHEDLAIAAQKEKRWEDAAKHWDDACNASIGHTRRQRYEDNATYCRKQIQPTNAGQ